MKEEEKRELSISICFILKYCRREIFANWIKKETQKRIIIFIKILNFLSNTFKFEGKEETIKKFQEKKIDSLSDPSSSISQKKNEKYSSVKTQEKKDNRFSLFVLKKSIKIKNLSNDIISSSLLNLQSLSSSSAYSQVGFFFYFNHFLIVDFK